MAAASNEHELEDLCFCVDLACLAYTDDRPGTVAGYDGPLLRGTVEAIEEVAGGCDEARWPLSRILKQRFGYSVDKEFSVTHLGLDTQGFIAHSKLGNEIALVFRGATNVKDWITNLSFLRVPFDPLLEKMGRSRSFFSRLAGCCGGSVAEVHRGFYEGFRAALPEIEHILMPQLRGSEPRRLLIAGHSLGGALATAALAYLLCNFDFAASPHTLCFVTIGAPAFGDEHFAAWVTARMSELSGIGKGTFTRIVNDHDLVPAVPPGFLGFAHVGSLLYCSRDGQLHPVPAGRRPGSLEISNELITDHEPIHYRHLVQKFKHQDNSINLPECLSKVEF